MDRNPELLRNCLVRCAFGQQREYVEFSRCKIETVSFGAALPIARHDGDCRRFSRRREAETGDAAEQRGHPVRERGITDLDVDDDGWRELLAHVSGLSAIVTLNRTNRLRDGPRPPRPTLR